MIHHHPAAELLLDYAVGALPEGMALAIATHAALCDQCRRDIRDLEALGAALLDDAPEAKLDDGALAAALARLDAIEHAPRLVPPTLDEGTRRVIPPPLRRYLKTDLARLPWKGVGRWFEEVRLPLSTRGMKAALMRIQPGRLMPPHGHRGREFTLVLAGGYRDGGQEFTRGDFDAKEGEELHQPIVDGDEECLCLVVLDAPVKLTGAMGRLVNPFLRI